MTLFRNSLRTEIEKSQLRLPIDHHDKMMVVGSCFAENIGSWLEELKFEVCVNPHGILYNPASIAAAIDGLLTQRQFADDELVQGADGWFYSFDHHGKFAAKTAAELSLQLNEIQVRACAYLNEAKHLLITFGTAWVFERNGVVVANCHKFQAKEFLRRRMSIEEIVDKWIDIIHRLPEKHFIFTVSPIRHRNDGLHGNQLSKATLLLAIDRLQQLFPTQVEYIPVYELLMDDLRDYRFYADDMVHPSSLAVEIIRAYFAENCLTKDSREYIAKMSAVLKQQKHIPLRP